MSEQNDTESLFGNLIYSYTRNQAIADGVLVDVSDTAREAGFCIPVAMTRGAFEDCVAWSDQDSAMQIHQDESGRLWDVLWMASLAARQGSGSRVSYTLYRVPRDGHTQQPQLARLDLVIGPGDAGEPVITVMLPGED